MGYSKQAFQGVGWLGSLRFLNRAVILLKTAILARILLPAQFGVFGIVTLTLSLFEILTETGINAVLIQEDEEIKPFINTAWVISIIRGILISVLIALAASPVAKFFSSPQAIKYLLLASLIPLIRGFINPSIVKFQKELEFKKEFNLRFFVLLIESFTAIILAFWTRSIVSLILSLVIAAFAEVVLSFIFCSPRPSFSWEKEKIGRIVSQGKWITLAGIFSYFIDQGDDAFVGRFLGLQSLGFYQVAYKISNLPFSEVTDVFSKVTFPLYSKISRDKKRTQKAFQKTLLATGLFVIPGSLLISLFPELIIKIILGENWLAAASALRILAIFGLTRAMSGSVGPILYAYKKQDLAAKIAFLKLLSLGLLIFPLTARWGLAGTALAVLGSSLIVQPFIWKSAQKILYENS